LEGDKEGNNGREGKCYQLAYDFMMEHTGCVLIHARVYSYALGRMIDHALVEVLGEVIYEPVIDKFFVKEDLYRQYKIKEDVRYTFNEMCEQILKQQNFGPWHIINENEEEKNNDGT